MGTTRRQFLAASGALGAAVALGACGGDDGGGGGGGGGGEGEDLTGTLRFVTWGAPAEIAAFEAIIRDFEAQNRGARIELQEVPYAEIRTTVDASLEAQQGPDLFRVSYIDFGFYAGANALLDLSEYLPADYGDGFTEGFWTAVTYEDAPYGVPHHTDVSALVYNRELLRRAGVRTVPDRLEDAWTWEEFMDVCRRVRDVQPGNRTAFGMNWQQAGAYRWLNWLYAAGGSLYDPELTTATVDSPEARRTLELFASWFEEELVPRNTTPKGGYVDELFPSQTIGLVSAGNFLLPTFEEGVRGFEYGVTFLPQDVGASSDLGGNAVVATQLCERPALAAAFLEFLANEENMRRFCAPTGVLPTRTALVDADIEYEVRPDLLPVYVQQATTLSPEYVRAVTVPGFTSVNTAFNDQLEAFLVGGQSADETLAAIGEAATDGLQA